MTAVTDFFQSHPTLWQALKLVFTAVVTAVVVTYLLRFEKKVTRKLLSKVNNINLRFVASILRFIVILLAVQWVIMSSPLTQSFGRILFQGTAIVGAIAGFAAQPVIADLICGLMLSATKPFDIGDRIELEDGTAGIVKDITLRHVVLQTIDTMRVIIPNSKLNAMKVTNMSLRGSRLRSIHFHFGTAYGTDVERAIAVIRQAVEESPHTVPGKPGAAGNEYGPVYFMAFEESSLTLATTVYFEPTTPSEVVKSDINARVKRALEAAGIEIPYNYINVVMNERKEA